MKRFLKFVGVSLTIVILTAGCTSSHSSALSSPTATVASLARVTATEFSAALKRYENPQVDEFDGSTLLTPKSVTDAKQVLFKNQAWVTFDLVFGKEKDVEKYVSQISVSYSGKEWMHFRSLDLKSEFGSMNIPFASGEVVENVTDTGRTLEMAVREISAAEFSSLSEIMGGKAIKLRLNGSGNRLGSDFTIDLNEFVTKNIRAGVTIWKGLEQGLSIANN